MVRVDLVRIIVRNPVGEEHSPDQYIFLRERAGHREFPIVIGRFEAEAINRSIHDRTAVRPMTHDLLHDVVGQLGARVQRVVVSRLEESTFFAELHLETAEGEERVVDCRPSDAIALAVRAKAALYVSDSVFDQVCSQVFLDLDP